jgi:hypothetical protein
MTNRYEFILIIMNQGHTDRAQRVELPIRHPPGRRRGRLLLRSPARPAAPITQLPGAEGKRGRAEEARKELEMWNGMEQREPGAG